VRLGIDLGTTRTVVSAALDGRFPIASFDVDGAYHEWIPGVAIERDGRIIYGWDALAQLSNAGGAVRSIKRAIAQMPPDDEVIDLPSRPRAIDLLSGFIAHVREMIVHRSSLDVAADEPLEATIAVPANGSSRQRWITVEAFRRAGISVKGVLNEPTAAGIEYAHRHLGPENKRSPKRYLVVYDLGGGTFDASAISLAGRRFTLLSTEGLARVGGDDFDEAILDLALARSPVGDALRAGLLERARDAKEAMTAHSKNVLVDLPEGPVVLDASAVLAACEPFVAQTIERLDALFAKLPAHGIDPENTRELGAVYVVGGAAAFVGVARALRARCGRKMQLAPSPHASTAIGLAIASDPDAGIYVSEAVTRHFGVWREAEGGREKIFDPIFDKDARTTDGELVVRRRYRPRHTVGHLRFLECSAIDDDGGPAGDLLPWREIMFPYDPSLRASEDLAPKIRAARQTDDIVETYRYEPDGAITVRIENVTRGYGETYELGRLG
jgi:molecular chaperone DnaK (HSP70)